jgi:sugar-specific transcriptional regulator TrmB
MTTVGNFVSPQALTIYKLLSGNGAMTAKDIGKQINIMPNAVYRANKQLLEMGIIEKSDSYPVIFSTVPVSSAIGWFLLQAQRDFKQTFGISEKTNTPPATSPSITFIKSRADLLNRTDKDVIASQKEVKFIVSGLEVPDSTVLAYRKAATKGVSIKALVQKRRSNLHNLEKWQNIGVDVRQVDDLELRVFIIDSRIVYLTSYSQNKKEEAFGVRFEYPPLATLMNDLFEQKWQMA